MLLRKLNLNLIDLVNPEKLITKLSEVTMSIGDILCEWGFPELVERFQEEGIDAEALSLLTSEIITQLIPKIGPRLKFLKKFETMFPRSNCNEVNSDGSTMTYKSDTENLSNTSSFDKNIIIEELFFDDLPTPSTSASSQQSTALAEEKFLQPTKAAPRKRKDYTVTNYEELASKRSKQQTSIFPNGLKCYLEQSCDGRELLKFTDLTDSLRGKLCKVILDFLFTEHENYKVPLQTFQEIAEEIPSVFTKESPKTYFVPYRPKTKNSPRILSSGKLWSKYINHKQKFKSIIKPNFEVLESDHPSDNSLTNEDLKTALENCKNCLEIEDIEGDNWENTYNIRKQMLENSTILEYFNSFPILKQSEGYTLLIKDFNLLYPNNGQKLFEKWNGLAGKILDLAKKHKIELAKEVENEDIAAILILPLLFSPTTARSTVKSKNYRPSRIEVQESFVLHVTNPSEILESIRQRRETVLKFNSTLQPFTVICGDLSKSNAQLMCYSYIDGQLYASPSVINALDTTFKIIFALDTKYAPECAKVWMFIQKYIYEINTDKDKHYSGIDILYKSLITNT